jgi:hypothetical protein
VTYSSCCRVGDAHSTDFPSVGWLVGFLEMGIDVSRPAGLFTPLAHAF